MHTPAAEIETQGSPPAVSDIRPARNQKIFGDPRADFSLFCVRKIFPKSWGIFLSPLLATPAQIFPNLEGENFVAKILVRVANFLPKLSCVDNSSDTRKTTLKVGNLRKYALSQVLTPALLCVIMQKMQV